MVIFSLCTLARLMKYRCLPSASTRQSSHMNNEGGDFLSTLLTHQRLSAHERFYLENARDPAEQDG